LLKQHVPEREQRAKGSERVSLLSQTHQGIFEQWPRLHLIILCQF